jgi:hypothetical protein
MLKPCETAYRYKDKKKKVLLQKAELMCNQYITEVKDELLDAVNTGKSTHTPILIEKGTTGNGGTSFFADCFDELRNNQMDLENPMQVLILVPLKLIRQSKTGDERYNIIGSKDPFVLDINKVNITTYAKAYRYYNKNPYELRDIIILFDEINYLKKWGNIENMFDLSRKLMKLNNVNIVLMTAYLDKYVREHIIGCVEPIIVNITVQNNGYEHLNTFITKANVIKNVAHITEGNINRLVLSTNDHTKLEMLQSDYPDTVFQVIHSDKFGSHLTGCKNIHQITNLSEIDSNLPLLYTSTIESGGDIYFENPPEHQKVFLIDNKNISGNNDINQIIGRIRNKACVEKVYVIGRNSKQSEETVCYTNDIQLPIDENYSIALNGKTAETVVFDANNKKFSYEYRSLYTILKYGYDNRYSYWEFNKKEGFHVPSNLINYLKYLKLKSIYPEYDDENNKEFLQKTLWKDWKISCVVNWYGSKEIIDDLFNTIDFNTDDDNDDYNTDFNDAKENTKLKMRLRAEIDTVIFRNNGKIKQHKPENVRIYNSLCNFHKDLRFDLEQRHDLYEYDIKTAWPRFLCFILHQLKEELNSDNFDFYDFIAAKYWSGISRNAVKIETNKMLNTLYNYSEDEFKKALKELMDDMGFDPQVYPLFKKIVRNKGNYFRTIGAMEDTVMVKFMAHIYHWFEEQNETINIIRIHDGIITTKPIPNFYVYMNDYILPVCCEQDTWREVKQNKTEYDILSNTIDDIIDERTLFYLNAELENAEPVWIDYRPPIVINVPYWTLYMNERRCEYLPVFSDKTYKTFVEKQNLNNSIHSECGLLGGDESSESGKRNDVVYSNSKGEIFTRKEVSKMIRVPIADSHFSRKAKEKGYYIAENN